MAAPVVTCYRHPGRRAGVTCQRCDQPICPDCMVQAAVGFHCPDCVARYERSVPKVRLHSQRKPVATMTLIGLNVAVFLLGVATSVEDALGQYNPLAEDWGLIGNVAMAPDLGVAGGEVWRIVSAAFLHAGPFHLLMNMAALWLLGSQLERAMGPARYVALYITALFAGAFGVLLVDPTALTVGASGAVFGLMGAAFALQKRRGIDPWASGVGGLIIVNLLFTFFYPGISVGGHVGGLLGGALAGYVLFTLEDKSPSAAPALGACAALSTVFFAGCLAVAGQDPGLLSFLNING